MPRFEIRFLLLPLLMLIGVSGLSAKSEQEKRPNILWIMIEDWGPDLSCYGTKGVHTPHVDGLASEGIRYETAFTTSPVCSTSRSAMMTGMHQNYIGAHQHRTHDKKSLPDGVVPIPNQLAEVGYYTCLMSRKIDCNFAPANHDDLFMGRDWKGRADGQPFFARVTFSGTHRAWNRDPQRPIAIKDVEIPPYYPDNDFVRRDWANGLEQMQLVDRQVGELLQRLEDEGLADNTLVFFLGDHGRCHIRGKQFLYDGGIRIPLIMRWPGKVKAGQVSKDLVSSLDMCATTLEVAGVTPKVPVHGLSLFSNELGKRKHVFAARGKMDETHDAMRTIRTKDYKLILNLMPERAWCQFNRYKESSYPVLSEMNVLHMKGKLTPAQSAFMASKKPGIELFDLREDPFEVNNVADEKKYAKIKARLLKRLEAWRKNVIHDQGVSDVFRAANAFPKKLPTSTVAEYVTKNPDRLDYNSLGWPTQYPTRSLEEWQEIRKSWEAYVFRSPTEKVARPFVPHTSKVKNKKAKKVK